MIVVGLGTPASKIASQFYGKVPYLVYHVDTVISPLSANEKYLVDGHIHPEDYEKNFKKVNDFNHIQNEEILFIVCGGGTISAVTLRLLEQLKNNKLFIMYIIPESENLCKVDQLHENVTFHVLQEYARSKLFEKVYLIDNKKVEESLGDKISFKKYFEEINKQICLTYRNFHFFEKNEPLFSTASETKFCIETFGYSSLGQIKKEVIYFDVKNIMERCYTYLVSEENDEEAYKSVKEDIKNRKEEHKSKIENIIYKIQESKNKEFKNVILINDKTNTIQERKEIKYIE